MQKTSIGQASIKVILLLIAVVVLIYIVSSLFAIQREQSPAKLSVGLSSLEPTAGESIQLPINIRNDGGDASQVSIFLRSEAFNEIVLNPVDVASGRTITTYAFVKVKDVKNGWYDVTISYAYRDINGTHSPSKTTARVYVIPRIKITDFAWEGQQISINRWPPKDTVGRTDSTKFYFKVQSESAVSTYTGLSSSTEIETVAKGLTITPDTQPIEDIGPQGKTREYSFLIKSDNTPPGKYSITIIVMSDGRLAAKHTVELGVS